MYLIGVLPFFLISGVTCQLRSISGHLAPSSSFPYVVSVQFQPHIQLGIPNSCTGSIIDKYWILTSAGCIYGSHYLYQIEAGTSIVGDITVNDSGRSIVRNHGIIRNVSVIFQHPDYNWYQAHISNDDDDYDYDDTKYNETSRLFSHDVALLKLVKPLDFNENISSIELGTLQSEDVIAVGWGQYIKNVWSMQKGLNFILLDVMGIKNCTGMHKEINNEVDSRTHICAYGGIDRTPCDSDLGGPLVDVTTSRLVGVLSGLEDCTGKYPVVYTKISEYIDWINSVTGLNLLLN